MQLYHRRTGARLPDDESSPEFAIAWALEERKAGPKLVPGGSRSSYAGLVDAYQNDDVEIEGRRKTWNNLSPETKKGYERVIAWMHAEGAGPRPAAELTQARCESLRDKAARKHGYRFGRLVVQFNRSLWGWVLDKASRQKTWGGTNPWANLALPARPKGLAKRNLPLRPTEVAIVLHAAPMGLARAFVLALSGMSGVDIVPIEWTDYHEGELDLSRHKTGVEGKIIVPEPLRPWLDLGPRPSTRIATNALGQPFNCANTLQTRAADVLARLVKKDLVRKGVTLHGCRHTIGKAVADGGGDVRAIQAALQHATAAMALHYSAEADKVRRLREAMPAVADFYGAGLQQPLPDWCNKIEGEA